MESEFGEAAAGVLRRGNEEWNGTDSLTYDLASTSNIKQRIGIRRYAHNLAHQIRRSTGREKNRSPPGRASTAFSVSCMQASVASRCSFHPRAALNSGSHSRRFTASSRLGG